MSQSTDSKMTYRYPFSPFPEGWYYLGFSHELAPGELLTRQFMGNLPTWTTNSLSNNVGVTDTVFHSTHTAQPINIPDLLMFTELKYRHRNFLNRTIKLQVPLKYGFSTPISINTLHRLAHINTTVYDPFLLGSDYALETTLFNQYDHTTKSDDKYEFDGQIALNKTFADRLNTRLQFTANSIQTNNFTADINPTDALPFTPLRPKMEVEFRASLDFLDNPANPTRGFSLSDEVEYINIQKDEKQTVAEDEVFGNFLKWQSNARLFLNFHRKLILAVLLKYTDNYNFDPDDPKLPKMERYRLGGV